MNNIEMLKYQIDKALVHNRNELGRFAGVDEYSQAFYYVMSETYRMYVFPSIIELIKGSFLTNISEKIAYQKGCEIVNNKKEYERYITCEGYIWYLKNYKTKKRVLKNE